MIKSSLLFVVSLMSISYVNFYLMQQDVYLKLEKFNLCLENNLDYLIDEEIYLVFDYSNIQTQAKSLFENYQVSIIQNSSMNFYIVINLESLFIKKEIKEEFFLKKGDLYEGIN